MTRVRMEAAVVSPWKLLGKEEWQSVLAGCTGRAEGKGTDEGQRT